MDAFTGERKHQLIKTHATNIHNTESYEKSVLQHVLAHQFATMSEVGFLLDGLHRGKDFPDLALSVGAARSSIATAVRFNATMLGSGGCLNVSGIICCVEAAAEIDGALCLVVSEFSRVCQVISNV